MTLRLDVCFDDLMYESDYILFLLCIFHFRCILNGHTDLFISAVFMFSVTVFISLSLSTILIRMASSGTVFRNVFYFGEQFFRKQFSESGIWWNIMGIMKRYTFKQIRIFKIWIWFKCLCTITYNLWVHNIIKFQWKYEFYFLKYIYVYIIFFVSNCQQPCGFLEELMVTQPGCLSAPNHCFQVSVTHTSLWLFFTFRIL